MAEEYAGLLTEAQICGEIPGNMDVKEAAVNTELKVYQLSENKSVPPGGKKLQ
jgi:hypothetical protein